VDCTAVFRGFALHTCDGQSIISTDSLNYSAIINQQLPYIELFLGPVDIIIKMFALRAREGVLRIDAIYLLRSIREERLNKSQVHKRLFRKETFCYLRYPDSWENIKFFEGWEISAWCISDHFTAEYIFWSSHRILSATLNIIRIISFSCRNVSILILPRFAYFKSFSCLYYCEHVTLWQFCVMNWSRHGFLPICAISMSDLMSVKYKFTVSGDNRELL